MNEILTGLKESITHYNQTSATYRQLTADADELRRLSKRVTFLVNDGQIDEADGLLSEAMTFLEKIVTTVNDEQILLDNEGYKAAAEELIEAGLTYMVLSGRNIDTQVVPISPTRRLGAYADLCGELARHSVNLASAGNETEVERLKSVVKSVLLEFSQTKIVENSYLRSKYDQAERALQKVENILYQLKLRTI